MGLTSGDCGEPWQAWHLYLPRHASSINILIFLIIMIMIILLILIIITQAKYPYILSCLFLPLHIIVLTIHAGCADRGGWLLGDPPVAVCQDDPSDPPLPLVSKCQVPIDPSRPSSPGL